MNKCRTVFGKKKSEKQIFPKDVSHFVIFACVKNRMICAIAINILNLKPFDFFLSNEPSPRFHQQRRPTYFLRTYV